MSQSSNLGRIDNTYYSYGNFLKLYLLFLFIQFLLRCQCRRWAFKLYSFLLFSINCLFSISNKHPNISISSQSTCLTHKCQIYCQCLCLLRHVNAHMSTSNFVGLCGRWICYTQQYYYRKSWNLYCIKIMRFWFKMIPWKSSVI